MREGNDNEEGKKKTLEKERIEVNEENWKTHT